MANTFELNCCILGGDSSAIFVVKISTIASVGTLGKVIKDEQKDAFQHVDADSLILSRVSVSIDENLKENLSYLNLDGALLPPTQKLSEVFSEHPVQTHLHIVVKCPPVAPTKLFVVVSLVRHAQSMKNAHGDSASDELSEWGRAQAENLGKEWVNVHIDRLYSSTLERAVETACEIAKYNKGTPEIEQSELLVEHYFGTTALQYGREGNHSALFEEVRGFPWGAEGTVTVNRDHRPSGGGESLADVARRGRQFVEKEILGRFAVPLARSLCSFEDMRQNSAVEMLPEGIPHIVVVSHNIFLNELYEGMWCWNKERVDSYAEWRNACWSRHILCYNAETKNLDYINMVPPDRVRE